MTGSFKERGAANILLQLTPAERGAASSPPAPAITGWPSPSTPRGSGSRAVIVMPEWAPLIKVTSPGATAPR